MPDDRAHENGTRTCVHAHALMYVRQRGPPKLKTSVSLKDFRRTLALPTEFHASLSSSQYPNRNNPCLLTTSGGPGSGQNR